MQTMTAVVPATFESAQRRLTCRTHAFGPQELQQAYGGDLIAVPPLPFSDEEIDRAVSLGQYLIYQPDKAVNGSPLTMQRMHDQFENTLGEGKLFYDTAWYSAEPLYTTDTPRPGWHLISRDVIPGSTGVNYVGQTRALANYLRDQVYAGTELPAAYRPIIQEFNEREDELERLISKDWKKGAIECSGLRLNQLFREKPVEIVHGIVVYQKANGRYPLTKMYSWTPTLSSRGYLVGVGPAGADGVRVYRVWPDYSYSDLGVRFFRGAVPNLER